MQPPRPAPPSAADAAAASAGWRARVEDVTNRAMAAIVDGRLDDLAGLFAELEGWADQQRAYQARCKLAELALGYRPPQESLWPPVFAVTARCLLDALEAEPREPVLLNLTGVLLYELTESKGAEELFRAAQRLDPSLPHVSENLAAARGRRVAPPRGAVAASLRMLDKRARGVAARAVPVRGLTLSLVMIVKDEQEMLPGCLEAVKDAVDEMIVVDTGSTDRTVEIAESFGAKVVHFPWNGSFADARNVSLDHATCDWVMYLDADEHMMPEDAPKLRELLQRTWREGFYLVETNYTGGDESGAAVTHHALRLLRRRPHYRFEGRIHEQKTHTMPTYLPERFETSTVRMRHYGYLRSRITSKDKSRRNIELLEVEARENPSPFNQYNLGSEYLALGDAATARGYFDRAWESLREQGVTSVGYAPLLASRVATARRGAGDLAAARQAVAEALEAYPDYTDLVLEDAMCAREQGDLAAARTLAERCVAMGDAPAGYASTVGSGSFLASCLLAEIEEALGNSEHAEALYRDSLNAHPDYVAPVLPLVSLMAARGADLEQIRAAVPNRPSAWLLAATALYESGNAEPAAGWFRDVLELQPANGAARVGLVEALLSLRRYDEAAREAAQEPVESMLAPTAYRARLFALAAAGDGEALAADLDRATAASVAWHDVELYRAWAAVIGASAPAATTLPAASAEGAATALEALLRVEEFDAFAQLIAVWNLIDLPARERHERLARIYLRRGFLESAADEWIASVQIGPESGAMLGLAQVALARGMRAEALEFAQEAVSLDPGDADAGRYLAALRGSLAQAA